MQDLIETLKCPVGLSYHHGLQYGSPWRDLGALVTTDNSDPSFETIRP